MRCSLVPRPYFHQIRPTNSRGLLVTHEPKNVLDNLLTEVVESQMPCDVHPIWTSSPVLSGWCHELHPFLHLMNLFKHMSYTRQNNLKLGSCTFLLGKNRSSSHPLHVWRMELFGWWWELFWPPPLPVFSLCTPPRRSHSYSGDTIIFTNSLNKYN